MFLKKCPDWEYYNHPNSRSVLRKKHIQILVRLRKGKIKYIKRSCDTRKIHRKLFHKLAPNGFKYYAGNYRGSKFRCLKNCWVTIPADPTVGLDPATVLEEMREIEISIKSSIKAIENLPNNFSSPLRLVIIVDTICRIFTRFQEIHPYANGNGHMGRYIIWSLLLYYGYIPRSFPIHPRPNQIPYIDLIKLYRAGNRGPFINFILRSLLLVN